VAGYLIARPAANGEFTARCIAATKGKSVGGCTAGRCERALATVLDRSYDRLLPDVVVRPAGFPAWKRFIRCESP
jgi:hypothetical protein